MILGAVGVGYVTDEIEEGVAGSSTSLFGSYTLRGLTIPTKIGVRFLSGGCIYALVDTLIIKASSFKFILMTSTFIFYYIHF